MLAIADYFLKNPEQIETPALLVFEESLDHNIRRVLEICGSPGVMKLNGAVLKVGDFFFAVPGHACTATVKYPYALVVNRAGEVSGRFGHDARDRDADLP
jgi:D-serine deaminase-like pyridoxal phosphate-dependent protein